MKPPSHQFRYAQSAKSPLFDVAACNWSDEEIVRFGESIAQQVRPNLDHMSPETIIHRLGCIEGLALPKIEIVGREEAEDLLLEYDRRYLIRRTATSESQEVRLYGQWTQMRPLREKAKMTLVAHALLHCSLDSNFVSSLFTTRNSSSRIIRQADLLSGAIMYPIDHIRKLISEFSFTDRQVTDYFGGRKPDLHRHLHQIDAIRGRDGPDISNI